MEYGFRRASELSRPEYTKKTHDESQVSSVGLGVDSIEDEEGEVNSPTSYRLNLPKKKFGTILADPPWRLKSGGVKRKLHYDTMDLEDIKSMRDQIEEVTLPDSHLWLWTTNPHLPEAFEVINSWGFNYKSCLTWDKELMGLGFWLRSRTEHCLFAVKSNKNRVQPSNITTLLKEKRRKHSQKPDGIISIIEYLSPSPRLELFARNNRPGWTCLVSDAPPVGDPYGQG